MRPEQVLAALADLAPAPAERVFDVTAGGQPFLWLGERDRVRPGRSADRLAGLDALHYGERILRRGVAFVVGQAELDGVRRTVRLPLLVQPVRLEGRRSRYRLVPAGDPELTPLVEDHEVAARLEAVAGLDRPGWLARGEAEEWILTAAHAAGLPITRVEPKPPRPLPTDGLVGVAASALFVAREARVGGVRQTLVAWSRRAGLADTALVTVYGLDGRAEAPAAPEQAAEPAEREEILSPLRLNAAQRDVVSRVRREPLVVVTGPPGNGKSHALIAAALDTVDRGGSVLMVAQSAAAVGALATLLGRFGGPTPVLFGDAEHREALLAMLERGLGAGASGAEIRAARAAVAGARERLAALRSGIVAALEAERRAADLPTWEPLLPGLAVDAPAAFRPEFDLARAEALWRAANPGDSSPRWWRRWSARWAQQRLRRRLGSAPSVPVQRLRAALDAAGSVQAAGRLASIGGTDLTATWDSLLAAEADLAAATGETMRLGASSARRWAGEGRRAAVVLAAALRAGRNRRRQILADIDGPVLVRALPLWIGTVTDVEDLLPPVPGLFDLVIVDEAVHVDQIRAAPVLARGRRALVAGDPRQLRFVSFVADVDVALTLRRHGLTAATDRIDVRRASTFDLAAGAAAVTSLTAHYRSAPHLIEFSARRFYGGQVALMTRHPRNEDGDHIDVIRVDGHVVDGVNQAEVAAVVEVIRELASAGTVDIGVVSPFRAQADALESALLAEFSVDEIKRLQLRTGTVYAFQGAEAETVIASLGVVADDAAARSRFVADPNLFNVLITRARQRMIVVTSLDNVDGLVGEYLRYAERSRSPRPDAESVADDWTRRLAVELRRAGAVVRPDYPVGPWRIDLCLGPGDGAVGLICRVHPDGVRAHIERQLALLAVGWRLVDAFPSRWGGDATRAAVELAAAPELPPRVDHDPQLTIDAI